MTCAECGDPNCSPGCGQHDAGCFYGGPAGAGYWMAVDTCPHPHRGDIEAKVASAEAVQNAREHLHASGLWTGGHGMN